MSRFVLDNTVTMAWCFTEEATEFTTTLLSRLSNLTDTAIVPALWLYEVVNVVELAVRKGRVPGEKHSRFSKVSATCPSKWKTRAGHRCLWLYGGWPVNSGSPGTTLHTWNWPIVTNCPSRRSTKRYRKLRWPRVSILSRHKRLRGLFARESLGG